MLRPMRVPKHQGHIACYGTALVYQHYVDSTTLRGTCPEACFILIDSVGLLIRCLAACCEGLPSAFSASSPHSIYFYPLVNFQSLSVTVPVGGRVRALNLQPENLALHTAALVCSAAVSNEQIRLGSVNVLQIGTRDSVGE